MNKFRISALKILTHNKRPLHYKEITRLALEKGILVTNGATPERSMNAQIIMDIKNRGERSDFIKTSPSTYMINPNSKSTSEESIKDLEQEKIEIESGYVGKAGEYLVCSELLFRGFNSSIMSVDTGLDIVASKENKIYGIQVKTARLNKFGIYVFDIRKVSFERHNNGSTYYIFVLYSRRKTDYLILPNFEIEKKIHDKAILKVGHGLRYRINIKLRDNNVYLGNLDNEMNYFLNNWTVLK